MKTLVIYYSLEGNTEWIAKEIARETGAELFPLELKKPFPREGFGKFFWGSFSVLFHKKPKLVSPVLDLSPYDLIYIGTPIWVGTYAPPIETLLASRSFAGKSVCLFACHGGGGSEKCFAALAQKLQGSRVVKTIDFCEPLKADSQQVTARLKDWLAQDVQPQ